MKRTICRFLAALSLVSAALASGPATRPRYRGTLRMEVQAAIPSLDPSDWPTDLFVSDAKERFTPLVYEGLVRLDENGRPQPCLAVSWQRDPDFRRWQFQLRAGVTFHNGSPLTAEAAAAALNSAAGWSASDSSGKLLIETDQPRPDLLMDLAQPRHFIFQRGADAASSGTGPFRQVQWQAGRHAALEANEEHWEGRPFLDAVTLDMGRALQEQLLDLELGKADLAELRVNDLTRASQSGYRIWSSRPLELMVLVFSRNNPSVEDSRLREAISLSIDTAVIHNVLLQKQGQPAGALLPQWLSGYAFLFPAVRDLERAKRAAATLQPNLRPLILGYEPGDLLVRSVAERIAVNTREAGIIIEATAIAPRSRVAPDIRLVRRPVREPEPGRALAELARLLDLAGFVQIPPPALPEDVFAAERALIQDHRVIPIAHLPEVYAVSPKVRSWNTPGLLGSGIWQFEDLWLDTERP